MNEQQQLDEKKQELYKKDERMVHPWFVGWRYDTISKMI